MAQKYSEEILLAELRELADELEKAPTTTDMDECGDPTATVYYEYFESWSDAIEQAGLDSNNRGTRSPTDDELLTELTDLAAELGERPTAREMRAQGAYSVDVYANRFGSWHAALERAELSERSRHQLSDEELLSALRSLAEELGETPSKSQMQSQGAHSPSVYETRFGSWNEAIRAGGLEPNQRGTRGAIGQEKLITDLRKFAAEFGGTPTMAEMDEQGPYHSRTYCNRFGSWTAALEAAELDTGGHTATEQPTEEELLGSLRSLADGPEQPPTYQEMNERGAYSVRAYKTAFGSWNDAVREAGFEVNQSGQTSADANERPRKEELLDGLRAFANDLGKTPSIQQMNDNGPYSRSVYRRAFGSWNDAVRAAGLEVNSTQAKTPKTELLTELQELEDTLGHRPSRDDMREQGAYSPSLYADRFGTWTKALKRAGMIDTTAQS